MNPQAMRAMMWLMSQQPRPMPEQEFPEPPVNGFNGSGGAGPSFYEWSGRQQNPWGTGGPVSMPEFTPTPPQGWNAGQQGVPQLAHPNGRIKPQYEGFDEMWLDYLVNGPRNPGQPR